MPELFEKPRMCSAIDIEKLFKSERPSKHVHYLNK